tara:strand:- start:7242 stop:7718 length:477 start_codon:yes stop_codon:yes gene_type:complete
MIKLYSIDKKKLSENKLSMAPPSFIFLDMTESAVQSIHVVEEDETGRIDLVSLSEYGTHDEIDKILKFNGISNPFSIKEGDVLLIPKHDAGKKTWKLMLNSTYKNPIREQFINTKRLPVKDANRIAYLSKKYNKEILPPNIIRSGEQNIDVSNGKIKT